MKIIQTTVRHALQFNRAKDIRSAYIAGPSGYSDESGVSITIGGKVVNFEINQCEFSVDYWIHTEAMHAGELKRFSFLNDDVVVMWWPNVGGAV